MRKRNPQVRFAAVLLRSSLVVVVPQYRDDSAPSTNCSLCLCTADSLGGQIRRSLNDRLEEREGRKNKGRHLGIAGREGAGERTGKRGLSRALPHRPLSEREKERELLSADGSRTAPVPSLPLSGGGVPGCDGQTECSCPIDS